MTPLDGKEFNHMTSQEKKPGKELYKQLRALSCETLWTVEVPRFDRAAPQERIERVAVIRAVSVVFSESGTVQQKAAARPWLRALLQDPCEKVRRYAMAALPRMGSGPAEEAELLALLRTTTLERERRFLGQPLAGLAHEAQRELETSVPGSSQAKAKAKEKAKK